MKAQEDEATKAAGLPEKLPPGVTSSFIYI